MEFGWVRDVGVGVGAEVGYPEGTNGVSLPDRVGGRYCWTPVSKRPGVRQEGFGFKIVLQILGAPSLRSRRRCTLDTLEPVQGDA